MSSSFEDKVAQYVYAAVQAEASGLLGRFVGENEQRLVERIRAQLPPAPSVLAATGTLGTVVPVKTEAVVGRLRAAGLQASVLTRQERRSGFSVSQVTPYRVAVSWYDHEHRGDGLAAIWRAAQALASSFALKWTDGGPDAQILLVHRLADRSAPAPMPDGATYYVDSATGTVYLSEESTKGGKTYRVLRQVLDKSDDPDLTPAKLLGGKRTPRRAYEIIGRALARKRLPPIGILKSRQTYSVIPADSDEVELSGYAVDRDAAEAAPRKIRGVTEYVAPYRQGEMVPYGSLVQIREDEIPKDWVRVRPVEVRAVHASHLRRARVQDYVHEYDGPSYPVQVDVLTGPPSIVKLYESVVYKRYEPTISGKEFSAILKFLAKLAHPTVKVSTRSSGTFTYVDTTPATALGQFGVHHGSVRYDGLICPIEYLPTLDAHLEVEGSREPTAGPSPRPASPALSAPSGTAGPRVSEGSQAWESPVHGRVVVRPGDRWNNLAAATASREDGTTGPAKYGYSPDEARWARGWIPPESLLREVEEHGHGALFGRGSRTEGPPAQEGLPIPRSIDLPALPQPLAEADGAAYFSADAWQDALDESGPRSRTTIVLMSPEDFLAMALPGKDEGKQARVTALVKEGTRLSDIPRLLFTHDGRGTARCTGHEGRHRARALQARGVRQMPVRIRCVESGDGPAIRWSLLPDKLPTILVSEDGRREIAMPRDALNVSQQEGLPALAPRPMPSIRERQDPTETPEFKRWFGKSVVVDAAGRPRIVYRGMRRVPMKEGAWVTTQGRATLSFTPDPEVASVYARQLKTREPGLGSNIAPVYLSIQRPLDLSWYGEEISLADLVDAIREFSPDFEDDDAGLMLEDLRQTADRTGAHITGDSEEIRRQLRRARSPEQARRAMERLYFDTYLVADSPAMVDMLASHGFDGVIVEDVFDAGERYYEGESIPNLTTYRPFDQNQVKSATGNVGTFDPNDMAVERLPIPG